MSVWRTKTSWLRKFWGEGFSVMGEPELSGALLSRNEIFPWLFSQFVLILGPWPHWITLLIFRWHRLRNEVFMFNKQAQFDEILKLTIFINYCHYVKIRRSHLENYEIKIRASRYFPQGHIERKREMTPTIPSDVMILSSPSKGYKGCTIMLRKNGVWAFVRGQIFCDKEGISRKTRGNFPSNFKVNFVQS